MKIATPCLDCHFCHENSIFHFSKVKKHNCAIVPLKFNVHKYHPEPRLYLFSDHQSVGIILLYDKVCVRVLFCQAPDPGQVMWMLRSDERVRLRPNTPWPGT